MKIFMNNWTYIAWFLFYVLLFGVLTMGLILPFYAVFFLIAFFPFSEQLWRKVSGIRPLRLRQEKDRLYSLLEEVKAEATDLEINISQDIDLFIQESRDINAFAFGRSTLVLTKGSIDMLNDEQIKGLIAHELGHFAFRDTTVSLFFLVANFPMSFLMAQFYKIEKKLDDNDNFFKFFFSLFFGIFKMIDFTANLMTRYQDRQKEYRADYFAFKIGFGNDLANVLIEVYQISMEKPSSIKQIVDATHPHITKRIEKLENLLDI